MCSQVLEVFLDPPQCVSALLQLGNLVISEGHVDHTVHTVAVQNAGQGQEDDLSDTVHVLEKTQTQNEETHQMPFLIQNPKGIHKS